MMHSKTYRTFDIVIVPFPFVDSGQTKNRPAIVVSPDKFNEGGNTVLLMITSSLHSKWPYDTEITDLKKAGLSKKSIIRAKMFTIDNRLIKTNIGELSSNDRAIFQNISILYLVIYLKKIKNNSGLIPYDPVQELVDENFVGKAILECLRNNDPEGVMEVIEMYLGALEKTQFVQKSRVPKSTLYHSLKSKNPTIKTLAKLVHATTMEARKV